MEMRMREKRGIGGVRRQKPEMTLFERISSVFIGGFLIFAAFVFWLAHEQINFNLLT